MSLRHRLLLIAVVLLTVGLGVSDAVVTAALRRHLVDRVDHQLRPITLVLSRVDPSILDTADAVRPERLTASLDLISALSVAYLDARGTVVDTVHSGAGAPPSFPASLASAPAGTPLELRAPDGGEWRAVVAPRAGGDGVVVVAAPLSTIDATVTRLRMVCLITGLVVIALLTAAGWVAIRAGLRPLRTIEETATAIASGDLGRRIPSGPPGTEVARLATALNAMLTQIERAFAARADSEARMRRFVADVSHELRTPLFGIKGSAELYFMRDAAEPPDVDAAMRRIDTEAGRLAALVDDLLLLARLDEPTAGPVLDRTPMDLRTLAVDARHDLRSLDRDRPIRLTGPGGADTPAEALVLGDEARLRQVVSNLVGNVHTHTPPTAPVRIGVGRVGADAVLEVADSGPGLTDEEAARVFERFSRADGSRSRGSGRGAGLGLAIVRSLVTAHGGRVDVLPTPGGGATFRVALPWLDETPEAGPRGR